MDVAHLKSSAIARQAARTKCGQPPFVRQLGKRICLIHELRKLGTTEEIADDRAERLRIDQLLRRHPINIDVEQCHALLDQALGPSQTDSALIGK